MVRAAVAFLDARGYRWGGAGNGTGPIGSHA